MKIKLSYLCFVCLFFIPVLAQSQSSNFWLDYYQYRLLTNDSWKLSQRMSLRYNQTDDYLFTAAYRPDYARKVRQHGRVIVGNGLFYNQGNENNSSLEVRPWIGFQRSPSRLTRVSLTHYARFENRFFVFNSEDFYEGRLRYKLSVLGDIYHKEGTALSVIVEPEVFFSLGAFDQFYNNRFRLTYGARYQWSPYWQTDFSVIQQVNISSDPTVDNTKNWVFQLKVKRLLLRN